MRSRALERVTDRLENGAHATIAEIAATEKINESYVGRVLRLTLLAPEPAATLGRADPELQAIWSVPVTSPYDRGGGRLIGDSYAPRKESARHRFQPYRS